MKETVACLVRDKAFIPALDAVDDAEAIISRDLHGLIAVTYVDAACVGSCCGTQSVRVLRVRTSLLCCASVFDCANGLSSIRLVVVTGTCTRIWFISVTSSVRR